MFGGGKIDYNVLRKIQKQLPNHYVELAYGMTELAGCITSLDPVLDKNLIIKETFATSGRVLPGVTLKVVDVDTGRKLGFYERGELLVKSSTVTRGYYNQSSDGIYDDDGWLKTGDIVYYDENYCFYIVDRIKEMFKYKSWHIVPAVLETVIQEHPAVRDCVVFGIPHETDGDLPTAVIILKDNYGNIKEEEIIKFVDERVDERQKLRGGIKFTDDLPRTPSGKIMRREVRKLFVKD